VSFQYSVTVRNARLDVVESTIGASAVLKVFSGAEPANCAAADPGGLLATLNLPADWMAAAASGSKAKLGTWSATASGSGQAASWRIYEATATTCHMQGNCTTDLIPDNSNVVVGQTFTVATFQLNAGNA
jgi:hypothetical protein